MSTETTTTTDIPRDHVIACLRARAMDQHFERTGNTDFDEFAIVEAAQTAQRMRESNPDERASRSEIVAAPFEKLSALEEREEKKRDTEKRLAREAIHAKTLDEVEAERWKFTPRPKESIERNDARRAEEREAFRRSQLTHSEVIKRCAAAKPDLYANRTEADVRACRDAVHAERPWLVDAAMGRDPLAGAKARTAARAVQAQRRTSSLPGAEMSDAAAEEALLGLARRHENAARAARRVLSKSGADKATFSRDAHAYTYSRHVTARTGVARRNEHVFAGGLNDQTPPKDLAGEIAKLSTQLVELVQLLLQAYGTRSIGGMNNQTQGQRALTLARALLSLEPGEPRERFLTTVMAYAGVA